MKYLTVVLLLFAAGCGDSGKRYWIHDTETDSYIGPYRNGGHALACCEPYCKGTPRDRFRVEYSETPKRPGKFGSPMLLCDVTPPEPPPSGMDDRLRNLDDRVERLEPRMHEIEKDLERIERRLGKINKELDSIRELVERIPKRPVYYH